MILSKSNISQQDLKPFGEYIYGPNAIYSALLSNKRSFYHRLFMTPIKSTANNTTQNSKRKDRFNDITELANKMQIPIEFWYVLN